MKKQITAWLKVFFMIIDSAVFALLLTALMVPVVKKKHPSLFVLLYCMLLIITVLIRRMNHILQSKKQSKKEKEDHMLHRLLLMSDRSIGEKVGETSFLLIRKQHPDVFDMMEAVRRNYHAVAILESDRSIAELANRYSPQMRLISRNELFRMIFPDEQQNPMAGSRGFFIETINRIDKYIVMGIIAFVFSLFVRSKIYYRFIASVFLIFGFATAFFGNMKRCKKL